MHLECTPYVVRIVHISLAFITGLRDTGISASEGVPGDCAAEPNCPLPLLRTQVERRGAWWWLWDDHRPGSSCGPRRYSGSTLNPLHVRGIARAQL